MLYFSFKHTNPYVHISKNIAKSKQIQGYNFEYCSFFLVILNKVCNFLNIDTEPFTLYYKYYNNKFCC